MRKKFFIIILSTFILCITGCSKSSSNIDDYLNTGTMFDTNAKEIMPNLDNLPKYESIKYKYTNKSAFIFENYSVALVVNYDDKTYKSEKDKLVEKYIFLDHKVEYDFDEGLYIIPEYKFSINSYTFKVVAGIENSYTNTEFPKSFGMIGTSEENKSIAYLYFYNIDLDYISEAKEKDPMANFVKHYFDYNF